jgi:TolB protein
MKPIIAFFLIVLVCSGISAAQDHPARKLTFERDSTIWIANIDGSEAKKIAIGQSPDLSPDGTKLAYNTVQDAGQPAHRQICVVDLATGKSSIFKDIPSDNSMEPIWSPDGTQLLFVYYANDDRRLGIVNADGSGFRYLQESEPKHQTYRSQTWAADGKSIFAQDMINLYRLDLNAGVLKKWEVEKLVPRGGMSGDIRLDASPDGKTLLMDVEMDEDARKDWDGPPPSIWTLDLATEKVTRLTPKSLYAWDCHWLEAPDSILFISEKPGEEITSIYRMSTGKMGADRKLLVRNAIEPDTSR